MSEILPVVSVEEWREIAGYPDYQVSSLGGVRSKRRTKGGVWRLVKGRPDKDGYLRVDLCADGQKPRPRGIHQLVAEAFIGPCPEGHEVCHEDGVRTNNVATNFRYDTHAGNMGDVFDHRCKRYKENRERTRTPHEFELVRVFRALEARSNYFRPLLKAAHKRRNVNT